MNENVGVGNLGAPAQVPAKNTEIEIPETTVIKRYPNRKLYDTFNSKYVTLDDIRALIKAGHNVQVIDNKTKNDITNLTLLQIVFETEKKKLLSNHVEAMTLEGLNQVIRQS